MPQPLQVKIFLDKSAAEVETQVNAWLASQVSASIIKTETVVTAVTDKSNGTRPWILVTIWYEPPASDQERPGFRVA